MLNQKEQILDISSEFQIYGELLHAETLKIGHINETYTGTHDQGGTCVRYLHQKLNHNFFRNPVVVIKNVMRVGRSSKRKAFAKHANCSNLLYTRPGTS